MNGTRVAPKEQVVLRLPAELHSWLKKKAQDADRSLNYTAVQVLQKVQSKEAA